ncbi:MAG: acylphosphatase [Burkholderiaceae bacterium]|jgi:acylphosphatase|nr:acylphosphatase [Pseudomonadota bacterium]MBS0596128.1 acylphosphatase [Pseudomonadota bacterium]MCO5115453.1 acylphosphatase [Burkholderiaceae bacterium]MCP5217167.1 acylphosphatase [Burkholderiaceae bacterium]
MKTEPICRHLRIEGHVQGVYYRASLVDEARRLGLAGWVRNRLDGSVEALAQGAPAAVQALIDWAHRGPPRARVSAVRVSPAPAHAGTDFEQRETA